MNRSTVADCASGPKRGFVPIRPRDGQIRYPGPDAAGEPTGRAELNLLGTLHFDPLNLGIGLGTQLLDDALGVRPRLLDHLLGLGLGLLDGLVVRLLGLGQRFLAASALSSNCLRTVSC